MNLTDWNDLHQRLNENGFPVAEIKPSLPSDERPLTWYTPGHSGTARSPAAAMAAADRQLRIDRFLPDYGLREETVPPCGHLACIGYMGCIVAVRARHGIVDESQVAHPGSKILLRQVSRIGVSDLDWVVEDP